MITENDLQTLIYNSFILINNVCIYDKATINTMVNELKTICLSRLNNKELTEEELHKFIVEYINLYF